MAASTTAWPEPNTHVDLLVDWWPGPLATRVEDHLGSSIVVAGPTTPGAQPIVARSGTDVRVSWLTERGPATMAGVLAASDTRGTGLSSWRVDPAGAVQVQQRREYARVTLVEPILVQTEGAELAATMVDLSEGGMSCVVFTEGAPFAGAVLRSTLAIGDAPLPVTASVVRASNVDEDRVLLAVRFEELSPSDADLIRREVFAIERRRREARP